ncbi:hypothetical protein ACQKPX_11825 [Photobacterium sp. DNB23_23_1]|uniref:Flavodoxin n=1 Tax=Photobacterium pectinilyticum TaxID=2906793 RepID=A0ABT1MWN0_9GAMM|nr:hypothetical protein [Photobacterium sp. ZSDE20]MCQ1056898.1 hypothetical protein [Photobacterium sp. ZSDE20]MDD1821033.1 hypothetical protein [Photobacterium sp. ZSDE20]
MKQLIERKSRWMASHITDAEFPTPLSEKGLALYQDTQATVEFGPYQACDSSSSDSLSIYPVDCHPLTIRYALVLANRWQNNTDKEAVIEYLTQIMFEDNSPAQLYVGFFKGKPAACGMVFNDNEHGSLICDIAAIPLPNQQQLVAEMQQSLATKAINQPLYSEQLG